MYVQFVSDYKGRHTGVFIPIHDWKIIERKIKEIGIEPVIEEPAKKEILQGIKDAMQEIKLIEAGFVKPKSFEEFLNEL